MARPRRLLLRRRCPPAEIDAGPPEAAPPPLDVPASLVKALGGGTYVEESCQSVMHPGWPYAAQKCTYQNGLVVTIANPEPDRVARWIVEARRSSPRSMLSTRAIARAGGGARGDRRAHHRAVVAHLSARRADLRERYGLRVRARRDVDVLDRVLLPYQLHEPSAVVQVPALVLDRARRGRLPVEVRTVHEHAHESVAGALPGQPRRVVIRGSQRALPRAGIGRERDRRDAPCRRSRRREMRWR